MRAAPLRMLQLLENQNAGAFAHHETVALRVPRAAKPSPGSSLRCESARMAANPPMPMGVMQASAPPQIITSASSALNDLERIADGMRAGGAGRRGSRIRTLGAGADGNVAGSQIDDGGRNKKRGDAAGAFFQQYPMLALDHLESADAAADVDAHSLGIVERRP